MHHRNSNADSQPTNHSSGGQQLSGMQGAHPQFQHGNQINHKAAIAMNNKQKIIVSNPRVQGQSKGGQITKNLGQNSLQKSVKNYSSNPAAIQRHGSFTGALPGTQQPVHGLVTMQSNSASTQHFGQFQTFKIKNAGLGKYQKQFQSAHGTSVGPSASGGAQQTKIVIQSQHGRNIKRQALGSGGVQLRTPMNMQQPSPSGGVSQQSQLKQFNQGLQQQQPSGAPQPLPHPPQQIIAAPSLGQYHREAMRGAQRGSATQGGTATTQNTIIAPKQNRLNKLQKQQNIHNIGGDHMSENGSNSVGLDQDEDVPETLSDENNGMYLQMQGIKDMREGNVRKVKDAGMSSEWRKSKIVMKNEEIQRGRLLSPTNAPKPIDLGVDSAGNQARPIYHSPQSQLQHRPLKYQTFQSVTENEEDQDILKNECESMHKLIKELNEQAMDMLYAQNQKNVSLEGGPGSAQEYLVIQRKLSEIKQSAMNEPDRGRSSKDEDQDCSDLQKSLRTLEKALKILTIQHQKQRILVKPIYISIITYNIACCHQQTNNLKKCDKLLAQSIKLLEEDIEFIDKILNEASARGEETRKSNIEKKKKIQRIQERLQIGKKFSELDNDNPNYNCKLCQVMLPQNRNSIAYPCLFSKPPPINTLNPQPIIVPSSLLYLKYTRLRQLTILLLQHCAILSQLNRHADALSYAHNTTKILHKISQLTIRILMAKAQNVQELERVEDEKEQVREVTEEFFQLHKQLKSAVGDQHLLATPADKQRAPGGGTGAQTSQKKERRGRNGRKPSMQLSSGKKLSSLGDDARSVTKRKKSSAAGIYSPLQTDKKKGEKFPRSRSQHSRRSMSKHSDQSGSSRSGTGSVARSGASSVMSQCLSTISKKTKKHIKQINAGLERLHTFGMSTVHKGILEQQEQSNNKKPLQNDNKQKGAETADKDGVEGDQDGANQKKTIQKTTSQKKLQNTQVAEDKKGQKEGSGVGKLPQQKKKQSLAPLTSLKFLDPKQIQNNDTVDNLSKVSDFSAEMAEQSMQNDRAAQQKKALAQSVSSSLEINDAAGDSLLRHDDGNGKMLSQSVEFGLAGAKNQDLKYASQQQDDELTLPEVFSDVNLSSVKTNSKKKDKEKPQTQSSKFSYYVRDQFQPLQKQKDNIEKLLRQFSEHQKEFLDIIFQNQCYQDLSLSEGGFDPIRGYDSGASGSMQLNVQKQPSFSPLVIKNLKLSFQSIEEIERLKRDFNMYRQTQRNQLGISKPTKLPGETGSRRQNRLNWIDLFNIGNVMLMRGQDIQVSHKGWNEISEFDTFEQIMQHEIPRLSNQSIGQRSRQNSLNKGNFKNKLNQKDSRNLESLSSQESNVHPQPQDTNRLSQYDPVDDLPELCLQRCNKYTISKDSFTEIVLLTVISYFCVSTEHRFINMNQDREKQQAPQHDNATGGSMFDLNNSNQSMPSTIRSAGIQGSGLNSTLQRSTKDRTQTSSTQRQLAARNQKNIDGNKSVQNTNFQSSNFNSNSSTGNQKHIQSLQEKGTGLQVHQNSQENNTAMLSNIENRGSHSEKTTNSQVDHQEYFLCKALHFGLLYLPPDSPLVQHLTQNYIKNYLQPRLQKREDLVQKFMQ